jgi:hypothetical protein
LHGRLWEVLLPERGSNPFHDSCSFSCPTFADAVKTISAATADGDSPLASLTQLISSNLLALPVNARPGSLSALEQFVTERLPFTDVDPAKVVDWLEEVRWYIVVLSAYLMANAIQHRCVTIEKSLQEPAHTHRLSWDTKAISAAYLLFVSTFKYVLFFFFFFFPSSCILMC